MIKTTKWFLLLPIACFMLAACGDKAEAKWQDIPFGNAETQQTQKRLFANLIDEQFPYDTAQLARVDINGDGKPEYILHTQHTMYCGSHGCSYAFFRQEGKEWVFANGIIAHSIQLGTQPDTNGNIPLLVNGERLWQWTGKQYAITK